MEIVSKLLDKEITSNLLRNIDNVFLDCDGVIWSGYNKRWVLFQDASATIDKLRALGKKVFLVTNNSGATKLNVVEKVRNFGLNVEEENIVCSPYIVGAYLKKINFQKKVYIIGNEGLGEELRQWGIKCIGPTIETYKTPEKSFYQVVEDGDMNLDPEVEAVVVGFDPNFDYSKLLKASSYLVNPSCLFLATNPDTKFLVKNTPYSLPAAGVLISAVESACGRKAIMVGKPSRLMFDILSEKFNLSPERTLMIGDSLHTDIVFGNSCGMKTLLVLSGISTLEEIQSKNKQILDQSNYIPQFYTHKFSDLMRFL